MGGMERAWRVCVLLVAASSLAAAGDVMVLSPLYPNGLGPGIAFVWARVWGTRPDGSATVRSLPDHRNLFDRDRSTQLTTPSKSALGLKTTNKLEVKYQYDYEVKVVRYKIHIKQGVGKKWYPKAWTVRGVTNDSPVKSKTLANVKDATFKNGVFKAKFKNPGKYTTFLFDFTEDGVPGDNQVRVKIAEIEVFGPRGQHNQLVSGGYPCKHAPRYMLKTGAMKGGKAFTNSDVTELSGNDLKAIFNNSEKVTYTRVYFRDRATAIVGYHFKKAVQVVQIYPDVSYSSPIDYVFEANKCDPSCDYVGEDGWEVLNDFTVAHYTVAKNKWLVKKPDFYRAYRVKFVGKRSAGPGPYFNLLDLGFLQC